MLEVGTKRGGRSVSLTDLERTRHIHIVGSIGSGKSKLMEHMIRQDISARRGLCLIDPKGSLADDIERWCASRGLSQTRRIHIVKPGDGAWTPGFNPLRLDRGELPNVRVDAAVAACSQVWGGEDLNQTPRLKKILRAVFFALAVRDLTISEAPFLLRANDPDGTRQTLTAGLPDSVFQFIWDDLNALSRREFSEIAESTVSRLTQFLTSPAVRLMLGQQTCAIDFKKVMDEGDIVIVNLGGRAGFSYEDARVVGTLITNDLFHTARARDEQTAKRHPFSLYVDEAHDFLTADVGRMLDLTRSLGLHAVLAHQRIGQLVDKGQNIFSAFMGSTRTKIVFGGLDDTDGEIMARELMRDELDLEEAKPILDRLAVVGEEPFWLESENWSESDSEATSSTETSSWSESSGVSSSGGDSFRVAEGGEAEQSGAFTSESQSSGSAVGGGRSDTQSSAHSSTSGGGRNQTLKSVRQVVETPYTLEEQLHRAIVKVRYLPDRFAIIKRAGHRSVRIRTRDVAAPLCTPAMVDRFRTRTCSASPYVASLESAEAEIEARQSTLTVQAAAGREVAPDDSAFHSE
jgi:hypothetical protein